MLAVTPVSIGWTGEVVFGWTTKISALDDDHSNEKGTQKLYAEPTNIYIYILFVAVRNVNVPLYLLLINLEDEGTSPHLHSFLTTALKTRWLKASRPSRFALFYTIQYKWNRTLGGPGAALDILRKDKMLAYAGIQTPDDPSPSPVITPTTLCRFLSTLAAGLLKC